VEPGSPCCGGGGSVGPYTASHPVIRVVVVISDCSQPVVVVQRKQQQYDAQATDDGGDAFKAPIQWQLLCLDLLGWWVGSLLCCLLEASCLILQLLDGNITIDVTLPVLGEILPAP
jgi:hypothetical protein